MGQVVVPSTAAERKGIQTVVTVKANGGERAEVVASKPVTFATVVELPPNTGKIVSAVWDFESKGTFSVNGLKQGNGLSSNVILTTTYTYSKPGTYFVTLRVASQRQGDAKTPYTLIRNLGRVRVVVK